MICHIKKPVIVLMFLFFTVFAHARSWEEISNSGTLAVGITGAAPPFSYYTKKELVGFEVDIIKEISKRLHLEIKWVVQPFNTLLLAISQDKFDIIASSASYSKERAKQFEFIAPLYCDNAIIVSHLDGPTTIKDLRDKTISVSAGTIYYHKLRTIFPQEQIKTFPTEVAGLQALRSKKVDAWVTESSIAKGTLKLSNENFQFGEKILPIVNSMVVQKNNIETKKAIDEMLQSIIADGTYNTIMKKYLPEEDIKCYCNDKCYSQ